MRISILATVLILLSCNRREDQIPYVPVDIAFDLNSPVYVDLNAIGGWTYIDGGSKGIIVYRKTLDDYVAFDRHCSFEPTNDCSQVSVDETNLFAVDTCCGSKFLISDGTVNEGPAVFSLRQYSLIRSGSQVRISN